MIKNKADQIVRRLKSINKTVAAAESCTAGLAADLIAGIPGASGVFWGSYICYSLAAKIQMLGIREKTLEQYGPVSRETACEMAEAALEKSGSDYAFSITGIAGPGSMSGKAPGTVWIAVAQKGKNAEAALFRFRGSRNSIRRKAAIRALEELFIKLPKQEL